MSIHSPLPWGHNDAGLIFGQCLDDDDDAPFVADVIGDRERAPFGIMTDEERANADHIVRACNLHPVLVAQLREVLLVLNAVPRTRTDDTDSYQVAANVARLLVKAEEVQP